MAAIGFDSSCQSVYSLPFNNVMFPLTVSQPKYATPSRMQRQKSRNFERISKKKCQRQREIKTRSRGGRNAKRQSKHAKLLKTCLCPLALGAYNEIPSLQLTGTMPLGVPGPYTPLSLSLPYSTANHRSPPRAAFYSINLGEILTSDSVRVCSSMIERPMLLRWQLIKIPCDKAHIQVAPSTRRPNAERMEQLRLKHALSASRR